MISDSIPFLANIAVVARADGTLSAAELGQLEAIRKECGFKKSDFAAAVRLAERGSHTLTPVGTLADQVKNLEFVLRVAYADSDLDTAEVQLITDFCHRIGLHQEQLDKLTAEVLASLRQVGKLCPTCAVENAADSRFCAKCGANLESPAQDIQVKFDIPHKGIAIEFAESSAASFPKALELAKTTTGYQTCQKNKKTWHLATFPSGSLADALPLASALSGIRNRALHMDGKELRWDEVFGFAWCASQRASAYRPVEYCFGKDENRVNPWGCKQARMDWTEWADWFCYGKWEKSGFVGSKVHWRFDKDRIRHECATSLHPCRHCPHLNASLAEAVVRFLPDVVVPESDKNWDYHQTYEEVPGAIKVVQKERTGGFTFGNEFWADGVRPKGLTALSDILAKAFHDVGIDTELVSTLTR
jgi:hypothetical protein